MVFRELVNVAILLLLLAVIKKLLRVFTFFLAVDSILVRLFTFFTLKFFIVEVVPAEVQLLN